MGKAKSWHNKHHGCYEQCAWAVSSYSKDTFAHDIVPLIITNELKLFYMKFVQHG